jgi:hypothetical protein
VHEPPVADSVHEHTISCTKTPATFSPEVEVRSVFGDPALGCVTN